MPCRRIKDDIEGFGIVYLEAAMAGLASIGGRGSGAEDAIADGDSGALVDGNDPAAIAQILIEMLSDRGRTLTVGARARERAIADFCWRDKAVMIERALEPA
jgi:phosphatidylinositol alpha-1,6-mannosyltransferase